MTITLQSTNGKAPAVSFREALLKGQAPDRGLYMPDHIPQLPPKTWADLAGASYTTVARTLITPFMAGFLDDKTLPALLEKAYDFPVPLEEAWPNRYVLRLDRGPTLSFKDFAARLMAQFMAHAIRHADHGLCILTATSGDTGGAVANAFLGLDRIQVVVLFPRAEITARQRLQMTTLGRNIRAIEVDGKFDDCQRMVKDAFADDSLQDLHLTSANSINFGRLLPQAVYYAYTYATLAEKHGPEAAGQIIFSVPCGNFGNILGGLMAFNMGMPVKAFIAATNENDEFPKYRETGDYQKIEPSRKCISSAMNVGHPSNLARLIHLYGGQLNHTGELSRQADLGALRKDILSISVDDETSRQVMRQAYQDHNLILEPHGSVSWHALNVLRGGSPNRGSADSADELQVSLETAHPAKFPEEVEAALGQAILVPEALARLQGLPESFDALPSDYPAFREYLTRELNAHV